MYLFSSSEFLPKLFSKWFPLQSTPIPLHEVDSTAVLKPGHKDKDHTGTSDGLPGTERALCEQLDETRQRPRPHTDGAQSAVNIETVSSSTVPYCTRSAACI